MHGVLLEDLGAAARLLYLRAAGGEFSEGRGQTPGAICILKNIALEECAYSLSYIYNVTGFVIELRPGYGSL